MSESAPGDPPATAVTAETQAAPSLACQATAVIQTWKHTSPTIGCRFSPDGQWVVSGAQDSSLQCWDVGTGAVRVLTGHESWVRALGFSPDSKTLYSAGYDGMLAAWSLSAETAQPQQRIAVHAGWCRALDVSRDGQWIATGGNDRFVRVWNAATGEPVHQLAGHDAHVYSVMFHPTEPVLLSGDLYGKVLQWNLADGTLMRTLLAEDLHIFFGGQGAHYGGVRSMSLSADGTRLACSGLHKASNPFGAVQEPLVVVLDWQTGSKLTGHVAEGIDRGICWRSVYHPSGVLVGSSGGGSGGFLLFWQPGNEKTFHQVALPNTVLDLDLHAASARVVTAHHDGHVRLSALQ